MDGIFYLLFFLQIQPNNTQKQNQYENAFCITENNKVKNKA